MIEGIIAYQFDNPEDIEVFVNGNDQDVNCWVYEKGYPVDEIVTLEFEVESKDDLNELIEQTKEFS